MANLILLYIPVNLPKENSQMSLDEELDLVHNMTNKYNVLKAMNETTSHGLDRVSDEMPKNVLDKTQSVLDQIELLIERTPIPFFRLTELVKLIMDDAGVNNCLWETTVNGLYWRMTAIMTPIKSDKIESIFRDIELLSIEKVSLSLITVNYSKDVDLTIMEGINYSGSSKVHEDFMDTIKARIIVAEVVNCVKKNALFTFDFLALTSIASFIGALAIVEKKMALMFASILIAPMLNPISALIFGIGVRNKGLTLVGLRTHIYFLLICIIFGLVFGSIKGRMVLYNVDRKYYVEWPNPVMGWKFSFHYKVIKVSITAALAGALISLSILGNNTSIMIGAAFTCCLVHFASNTGTMLGQVVICLVQEPDLDANNFIKQPLSCISLTMNTYVFQYSCNPLLEMLAILMVDIFILALMSVCMVISGVLVLRIKEVVPKFSHTTATDFFFKAQIPLIRQTLGKEELEMEDFEKFTDSFSELYDSLKTDEERLEFISKWQQIVTSLESDPVYSEAMKNLPVEFNRMFKAGKFQRQKEEMLRSSSKAKSVVSSNWNTWLVPSKVFKRSV